MNPEATPIRGSAAVRADASAAFRVFTAEMGTWWPVESYSRAVSELADEQVSVVRLEFQPRLGGAIVEHLSDGRRLLWGEVVEWDPPHRVVISWKPHPLPEPPTELEVTFLPETSGTLVEVEHRGWDRLSEGFRTAMHGLYARGWPTTLERFVEAAESASTDPLTG